MRDDDKLGGYRGRSNDSSGDGFVGGARRGGQTHSTDIPLGKDRSTALAFIGGRPEIVGDHFAGDDDESNAAGDGFVGSSRYADYTAQTDLAKVAKGEGYAFVAGRGGKRRNDPPEVKAERRKAKKLRRAILKAVRANQVVPAAQVDAYIGALNRAYAHRHGQPAAVDRTQVWKEDLLSQIAHRGGKVHGDIVSGMGDWLSKVVNYAVVLPAKGIAKGVEFGARTVANVATGTVKAGKSTFFPGSSKKKPAAPKAAGGTSSAPADDSDDELSTYATRIGRRRALIRKKRAALESRLKLAQAKKDLAATEDAEDAAVADLEAQAAEAEAEADSSSGDDPGSAVVALAKDQATQKRIAAAVVKTAGNYAKGLLLGNPLVKFARQAYLEAKVDTRGPEKVAKLRDAAAKGSGDAKKALEVLQVGKKADEEVQAANVVNSALSEKAAEANGVPTDVVGLLPSSERVVSVVPGAKETYALAKRGDRKAVDAVRRGGDLLTRSVAGDAGARKQVRVTQAKAANGDRQAQADMAVMAVAAAGLHEKQALGVQRAALAKAAGKKAAEGAFREEMDSLVAPLRAIGNRLGGARYAEGLQVKLAQRR